jgi:hypothetical protein
MRARSRLRRPLAPALGRAVGAVIVTPLGECFAIDVTCLMVVVV